MNKAGDNAPRQVLRKLLIALLLLILFCLGVILFILPSYVERRMNGILNSAPYRASEKATELHRTLFIADLHADSLLWGRDLLKRGTTGHVDLPRLREGNVGLQVFSVVTKTPRGLNIERNDARSDNIEMLAVAELWPPATWHSLNARALYQAGRLRRMASQSNGGLVIIKTSADLSSFVEKRKHEPSLVAALLSVEGAHALEGDLANLDKLFDAGFRMMAPTHFFDTEFGGSSTGVEKGGLTAAGREMIQRMEAKGMIVDLAHASASTIDDAVAIATKPLIISHTGVKGTCDNNRNVGDAQLKGVAKTGGIVGIGYWGTATCSEDAQGVATAIHYVTHLIGVEHVALGSDFDGATIEPFDTSGLVRVTDALLAEGFSEGEIRLIMGGNVLRLLMENLPRS
jgi:membrane dipeptidase